MVPLKFLSNFWRTLKMLLINNLFYNRFSYCQSNANIYNNWCKFVPVVNLLNQDNGKLLQQLKSGFIRTINWSKYQSKVTAKEQNRYLYYLIDPCFQGINTLSVLSFENNTDGASYSRYYIPLAEITDYNVMIDGRNVFDQTVKDNLITYGSIWKMSNGPGDNYTTGCMLDYPYFKNYCKMIATDWSKQQTLDSDLKA